MPRIVLEQDDLWYIHLYCPTCDRTVDEEIDPQGMDGPIRQFFSAMDRHNASVHPS